MGLHEQMKKAAQESPRSGIPCRVKVIYKELQKPDADELREALVDSSISASIIARVLTERGYKITANIVGHHRRGGCSCERI